MHTNMFSFYLDTVVGEDCELCRLEYLSLIDRSEPRASTSLSEEVQPSLSAGENLAQNSRNNIDGPRTVNRRADSDDQTADDNPTTTEGAQIYRRSQILGSVHNQFCTFCKKNGEPPLVYCSHKLRNSHGNLLCPILRRYVCPLCQATEDDAHTIRHCPVFKKIVNAGNTENE